jgi:predicted dehydrogenase
MTSVPPLIGICLYGSGYAARVQLEAYQHVRGARVMAIAARHRAKAEALAAEFGIASVDVTGTVDVVGINHQGPGERAQVDEMRCHIMMANAVSSMAEYFPKVLVGVENKSFWYIFD